MSALHKSFMQYWDEVEREFAVGRHLPEASDPDNKIFRQLALEKNAKRCEAVVLHGGVSPLFQVRALLFRGRFEEAEQLLSTLQIEKEQLAEFLNERARLHCFSGEWSMALEAATQSLKLHPSPVTQLALHQIKALCAFELGQLKDAKLSLELGLSLAEIYPHCVAAFYLKTLRISILARSESIPSAEASLKKLWNELANAKNIDADKLYAVLRTKIDLLRLQNQQHFACATGIHLISEACGDRLYSALAMLDMYGTGSNSLREILQNPLRHSEFKRVQSSFEQVVSGKPLFTTLGALTAFERSGESTHLEREWLKDRSFQILVFPEEQVIVKLTDLEVLHGKGQFQLFQALRLLSQGPIHKLEFFKVLWGNQKFTGHLHDPLIWRLLHRLRKNLKVQVETDDGMIVLRDRAIILCI